MSFLKMILLVLVVGLCLEIVVCAEQEAAPWETKELSDKDIEEARDIDAGRYSTMAFHYFNNQDMKAPDEHLLYNDSCIDEYMRCLLTVAVQTPVCSYNHPGQIAYGYYSANTYCEVYFDNCLRGYRYWRIIDYGVCQMWYYDYHDDIGHTFRRSQFPLIVNLLSALSSSSGNALNAKYIPQEETDTSTKPSWTKIEGIPINNVHRSGLISTRRVDQSLVLDLLKTIATQSGKTQISVSKYKAPMILPEPLTET